METQQGKASCIEQLVAFTLLSDGSKELGDPVELRRRESLGHACACSHPGCGKVSLFPAVPATEHPASHEDTAVNHSSA